MVTEDYIDLCDYLNRETNWGQLNRLGLFDILGAGKLMEVIACPKCKQYPYKQERDCENFYCRVAFNEWTKQLSEYTDQELLEMLKIWEMERTST